MNQIKESIDKKNSILLARNSPVALVVGAASFLGSHLIDQLLDKGIQVVGVDDLITQNKQNLQSATRNRNFHLIIQSPDKLELGLDRLDYLFIASVGEWNLDKVLELFKKFGCRCLLISSIDLYEKNQSDENLTMLKDAEAEIAKFASKSNLNARVLRLGPVYGPRMDFAIKDPTIKLIQQALTGNLQKESVLEFSSRAIYVSDAIDLIIKTMLAGNTAQKIFDGVSLTPVKVSEIKQVLLDPIWYENRDFTASALPPWPTPNLDKTVKFLNWQPKAKLVSSLRATLSYFRDNEIKVERLEDLGSKIDRGEGSKWSEEKKEVLTAFKKPTADSGPITKIKGRRLSKFPLSKIYLLAVVLLIGYSLIWPGVVLVGGIFSFRYHFNAGLKNLEKGEFDNSLTSIKQASRGVTAAKSVFDSLAPIRATGLFKDEFELAEDLVNISILSTNSAQSSVRGMQVLLQAIKAVTGESTESASSYFNTAQLELVAANGDLSKINALLSSEDFNKNLLPIFAQSISGLSEKLSYYSNLVSRAQAISLILPKLVALDGSKNYLVLLQNNMELRPGGGFIGSFAKITFAAGKLKKLEVNDIYAIDGQLNIHIEPPKEIKEDLGQNDWFLRDSNWESDFPSSARQAEWFYTKETGEEVAGVVALDISAMEELLAATGPLDLPDYNEKITAENLFEKAVSHAELSFFPGSQAKKSFLTALSHGVFNKIFFFPQSNWSAIISALARSFDEKHISIYLNDPKLFSYLDSQGWTHALPRPEKEQADFLSLVEANLGGNKANYYLNRNYDLETVVGKDGEVRHRLRISYTNRSPSDAFPGGLYKNRMRIYLPFGSKLTRVLWGEADITKQVTAFVDYGRSGFSMLLQLAPKEQKNLVLDYLVPTKLEFKDNIGSYRLDIIKQAGTLKDPLEWTISYPISFKVTADQFKKIGPQQVSILTDLSTDRSFEVEFKK